MPDRQTLKVASLYGVAFIGAIGLELILQAPAHALGPGGELGLIALVAAWGLWFAGMAWRRTDEAAREAHKFAAFWGTPFGFLALILGFPAVAVLMFHVPLHPPAELFTAAREHWGLIMVGIVMAALAQVLGYLVAWAGWWLKRR
jgi:hypothetical protein